MSEMLFSEDTDRSHYRHHISTRILDLTDIDDVPAPQGLEGEPIIDYDPDLPDGMRVTFPVHSQL